MSLSVWQRQYDLAQNKLLKAQADLAELESIVMPPEASEELRARTQRVHQAILSAIERHHNEMKEAAGHTGRPMSGCNQLH